LLRIGACSNGSPHTIGDKTLDAEPRYLSAEEVVALHNMLLGAGDVDPEGVVRDWNLLASAVARPRMAAHYEAADLLRQAATLLWGLVENHAFYDGNKRTGWVAMRTFLVLNALTLAATEDESFELVVAVAQGMSLDATEAWLRDHVAVLG
jgi:death-on-curing protein